MAFSGIDQQIIDWFVTSAYDPWVVYSSLTALFVASSFGLPVPEEVGIVAVGLVAHVGSNPELYPPPAGADGSVTIIPAAIYAFSVIFLSDLLIYYLGRVFGPTLIKRKGFRRLISPRILRRIENWMNRYGHWSPAFFRFIPGVRFPGHLSCGMLKVPLGKFILVDGAAALVSVPTQVILIGYFGQEILEFISELKVFLVALTIACILAFILFQIRSNRTTQ